MNPATKMVLPCDEQSHDYLKDTEAFMQILEKLYNHPIAFDLTLFVDESCIKGTLEIRQDMG